MTTLLCCAQFIFEKMLTSISTFAFLALLIKYWNKKKSNGHVALDTATFESNTNNCNVVEVCLSDLQSALEAWNGGANSIELCVDRSGGGLTPSIGLIQQCCSRLGSSLHINVLIRPRLGNFVYSDDEFDIIIDDIIAAKNAGANGSYFTM